MMKTMLKTAYRLLRWFDTKTSNNVLPPPIITKYVDLDWEVLSRCQYPVPGFGPTYEDDCGEPAGLEVSWWDKSEPPPYHLGKMKVCPHHFSLVLSQEVAE